MKVKFLGIITCILLIAALPITTEIQTSQQSRAQPSDSFEDYQEIQLLPDIGLDTDYEIHENDNHDAFEVNSMNPGVELRWSHQDGDELDFRHPSDITNNLPDCEEYVYVSESFTWDYNVLPTIVTAHLDFSVNLIGDFDSVSWPQLYRVYAWVIDSSEEWTRVYSSYSGGPISQSSVNIGVTYEIVSRVWGGTIQNNFGAQVDPTDTLRFAVGLGPTYAFETDESEYWNWMNGVVQVIVESMSLTCVVNPTPDVEDTLAPDFVRTRGSTADEITFDIAVSEEGDIYTLGSTQDEISSMTLTKWNSAGAVYWTDSLHGEKSWRGLGIAITDDEIIAVGSALVENDTDTLIAKWNHQGLLIWNKTISLGDNDIGAYVDISSDGSIFVIGSLAGEVAGIAYLAKFSRNGELLWAQNCGYSYSDYPRDLEVASDGFVYTATLLSIEKWDSRGALIWSQAGVFSSVKVTSEGDVYTTSILPPTNLLQQWDNNGTKGWNITFTYDHTYAGEQFLYPLLIDLTPAGWAYVKLTSAQGIGYFRLAIIDTEGELLWNQTMDPAYLGYPHYFGYQEVACVHSSGFVCFAPSIITARGDLDFCLQFYLTGREPPIITSPLTIMMVALAVVLIIAIPIDYLRRKRAVEEEEGLPEWMTTQVYLRS